MNTTNKLGKCLATVLTLALLWACAPLAGAASVEIRRDQAWYDTDGNPIHAQQGCIYKEGLYYYWVGMDYQDSIGYNCHWNHVKMYRSTDLGNWTFVVNIASPGDSGYPAHDQWLGIPRLVYNSTSEKYLIFYSGNNNPILITESSSLTGPYKVVADSLECTEGVPPMGTPGCIFQDGGICYIIGDREDAGMRRQSIWRLRSSDYHVADSLVYTAEYSSNEASWIFKRNGKYFIFASGLNGWGNSATSYKISTSITSGWSSWSTVPTSPLSTNSYGTQHTQVLPVIGTQETTYMYIGDRYSNLTGNGQGEHVWCPIVWNGDTPTIQGYSEWNLDAVAGTWNTAVTYKVTYNTNGATSGAAPASQTKIQDVPLVLATNTGNLAKTSFTFAGWNTAADGSGTDYAAGVTYAVNAGLTLFAKWTAAASGALVWWKFDESSGTSAADSSGNGNTGTLTNMAGTEWTTGKIGNCLNFDGVNDHVLRTALSSSLAGDITVSLWMKRNGVPASSSDRLFDLARSTSQAGLNMKLMAGSGYLALDNDGGVAGEPTDNINLCDNTWHHVALTRTASAPVTFRIYVDGVLRMTDNNAQNTKPALGTLYVGARQLPTAFFRGMLDDVRVYARALSGAEIQGLAAQP